MAQKAYRITTKPLHYNGKTAAVGDVVTDLPGISIPWLRDDGLIAPFDMPVVIAPDIDPAFAETPATAAKATVTETPSA